MDKNQPTGRLPEVQPSNHLPWLSMILTTLTFLLTGLTSYLIYQNQALKQQLNNLKQPQAQACTLEAKICPDGSSVGRTLPNCEFAPCPASDKEKPQHNSCPKTQHLDCMPILSGEAVELCQTEKLRWIKTNCPNIKITY